MVIWLSTQKKSGISDEQTFTYLTRKRVASNKQDPMRDDLGTLIFFPFIFSCIILIFNLDRLDDELMKLMNLGHDWLHSIMPFIMSKTNRVSYGCLSQEQVL